MKWVAVFILLENTIQISLFRRCKNTSEWNNSSWNSRSSFPFCRSAKSSSSNESKLGNLTSDLDISWMNFDSLDLNVILSRTNGSLFDWNDFISTRTVDSSLSTFIYNWYSSYIFIVELVNFTESSASFGIRHSSFSSCDVNHLSSHSFHSQIISYYLPVWNIVIS
jgi:hypothetical protein